MFGGIAGFHEVEVDIDLTETDVLELCTEALAYKAFQENGIITIIAYGQHNSAGYDITLELSPIDISTAIQFKTQITCRPNSNSRYAFYCHSQL